MRREPLIEIKDKAMLRHYQYLDDKTMTMHQWQRALTMVNAQSSSAKQKPQSVCFIVYR